MGPLLVVSGDPRIKVGLQLVDRAIDLFAERHPVELIQDGAMETLANTVCLFVGSWSWCGCDRCPRPRGRARIRGSGCRKIRYRDRSAFATSGWRARHRTAPSGR